MGAYRRLPEGTPEGLSDKHPVRTLATLEPGEIGLDSRWRMWYIHRVVETYGPQRVFWGTDLTRLPCPYRQAVTLFTEEVDFLSPADQEWIMGRGIAD